MRKESVLAIVPSPDPDAEFRAELFRPLADMKPAEIADHFGDCDLKIQQFKTVLERHEELKKAIAGLHERHPADRKAVLSGKRWEIKLSERSNKRTPAAISEIWAAAKAWKKMALTDFLDRLSITLGALEEIFGKTKAAELITEERSGYRRITAVSKSAPVAPKAA